jgi:hypothetical protein
MIAHRPPTRNSLVTALSDCADSSLRTRARRFLLGLSADELEFIAGFVGACILESAEDTAGAAASIEQECPLPRSGPLRSDREHKLILLREFLHRSRRGPAAA